MREPWGDTFADAARWYLKRQSWNNRSLDVRANWPSGRENVKDHTTHSLTFGTLDHHEVCNWPGSQEWISVPTQCTHLEQSATCWWSEDLGPGDYCWGETQQSQTALPLHLLQPIVGDKTVGKWKQKNSRQVTAGRLNSANLRLNPLRVVNSEPPPSVMTECDASSRSNGLRSIQKLVGWWCTVKLQWGSYLIALFCHSKNIYWGLRSIN